MTTFAKRIEDKDVVHFLNFTNTDDLSWRDVNGTRPAPALKTNIPVTVKVARPVGKLWVASPDIDGGAVKELSFKQNGSDLSFVLPSVEYWTMAVVEYKNVEDNIFITGDGVQKDKDICKDNGAHVDNLLRGVLTATDIKSEADGFTHYILAKGKEGIGFYPTKDGTIAANKAYLALPSDMAGAKAVMIDLGNAATSIASSAANSPTSNSCYNLAGIRIPASTKGLHVEKGKKVVVR